MKPAINCFFFVALTCFLLGVACQSSKDPVNKPDLKPVTLQATVGDTLNFDFESSPSTGYVWQIRDTLPGKLSVLANTYLHEQKGDTSRVIGGSSIERWQITPLRTGTYPLTFVYQRPWVTDSTEHTVVKLFQLKVKARS